MAKSKGREQTFEASLSELERIVAQLESGDLPLERALELFEEGVAMARSCQSQLQEAERKVELLLRERGEIKAVPFDSAKDSQPNESEKSWQHPPNGLNQVATPGQSDKDEDEDEFDQAIPF